MASPLPSPSPQYWIVAESPDHRRAIIFQTRDEKVLHMRTGLILNHKSCHMRIAYNERRCQYSSYSRFQFGAFFKRIDIRLDDRSGSWAFSRCRATRRFQPLGDGGHRQRRRRIRGTVVLASRKTSAGGLRRCRGAGLARLPLSRISLSFAYTRFRPSPISSLISFGSNSAIAANRFSGAPFLRNGRALSPLCGDGAAARLRRSGNDPYRSPCNSRRALGLQRCEDFLIGRQFQIGCALERLSQRHKTGSDAEMYAFVACSLSPSSRRSLSDDGERPPERRVGVQRARPVVHEGQHRIAQGSGAAELRISLHDGECRGGEPSGRF
jgi:hypothetical protein